ncbi:benzoate transporter [Roseomonas eburnea]|uniref:Benzoate transporter n=1 Tax=Neoroseomonas eburnea TaxID=1346889 RepID=A0A9X9XGP7_9PROT|nr:benzoate transporter [Neoroseomonas eburnea]
MSARPSLAGEVGGAFGDLGTLLPIMLGAIAVAGFAPGGVLTGFGTFLLATATIYRLPLPVQPMKAIGAVVLTGGLSGGEVAAAGLATGVMLLALGATGAMAWVARAVPRSAVIGLQLGLGVSMAWLGLTLAMDDPISGGIAAAVLLLLPRWRAGWPAAPLALFVAGLAASMAGAAMPAWPGFAPALPALVLPQDWEAAWRGIWVGALPQLPLTLANAVIVTALLAREMFPTNGRVTERRLALTTGAGNLLLAPFGAMPMCHGAGGLVAQHRFGARTGWAPALRGAILLVLGLGFAGDAAALLGAIPLAAVGALLVFAGGDLALSTRLVEARPDCRPAIAAAALGTFAFDPAVGLAAGWIIEVARGALRGDRPAAE